LPALLGRTLKAGQRAVVICGSEARVEALDASLWLCTEPDWLPHGTAAVGHADLQPIWLTHRDEAPNGARYLFLLDGADSASLDGFERVFDLFDGRDDEAVAAARERYRQRRAAGHLLTYWQQTARGWEKK
jgi:DNA polymerase-3 subunit chi